MKKDHFLDLLKQLRQTLKDVLAAKDADFLSGTGCAVLDVRVSTPCSTTATMLYLFIGQQPVPSHISVADRDEGVICILRVHWRRVTPTATLNSAVTSWAKLHPKSRVDAEQRSPDLWTPT
ncbi:uncharacterized protein LOC119459491 [Dermacentor silvarum]|uniref:uncharacterized protein LOC119459491 n=1 Tax=Dermacentor silvarum TaxID=543639 RepID=UPI002101ABCE|nr:uncharacterized protein LOC119459491 [Dermacentor silvarum]